MQTVSALKYLTREERKMLLQKNDWVAAHEIILQWLWIAFAFALPYFFPNAKMHRLIKAKGYYEKGVLEKNYWNVIQLAIQE